MKKNILLLANIYKDPDVKLLNQTDVCHYFTKEWVKMGYEVKVIYNYTIYTKALHTVATFFEKHIANWALSSVNTIRPTTNKEYTLDGVKVIKLPIFKFIPRIKFSKKTINKQFDKIISFNKKHDFVPDIVVGHFHNPSLILVNLLKKEYSAKTCIVLHGDTSNIKKMYKNNFTELINNIDIWGYRSKAIGSNFEKIYGIRPKSFICYSGIPVQYLSNSKEKVFSEKIYNFIYVGALIKRKHPISLLYALNKVYTNKKFSLTYVGKGAEKKQLIEKAKTLELTSNVKFLGHISREEVSKQLYKSDVFIMISENEAFGLVYLEAMAKGCITIGSINEGIDGIIKNKENGFLCEAGNNEELADLLKKIKALTIKQKHTLSRNARATCNSLTDFKAAETYVQIISGLKIN